MTVTIRRTITVPSDRPYDCAIEPTGAARRRRNTDATVPARGAYTVLRFRPGTPRPASRSTNRSGGDDQPLTVDRPMAGAAARPTPAQCASLTDPVRQHQPASSAATGTVTWRPTPVSRRPSTASGADSTARLRRAPSSSANEEPIGQAPSPSPTAMSSRRCPDSRSHRAVPRPASDLVHRHGFPPGTDVGGQIGQRPDGKDTSQGALHLLGHHLHDRGR